MSNSCLFWYRGYGFVVQKLVIVNQRINCVYVKFRSDFRGFSPQYEHFGRMCGQLIATFTYFVRANGNRKLMDEKEHVKL